jgi:hypothetical protein
MATETQERPAIHWHVFREWVTEDDVLVCDSAPFWSEASARYVVNQIGWSNMARKGIMACQVPVVGDWENDGPIIYARECQELIAPHEGEMPTQAEVIK